MQIPVSVLVQTKNEAAGIAECLKHLDKFAEVIVVDSNSTDGTTAIAEQNGASVVNFTWDGHYPKKKQWQLDNVETKCAWILFLDADETPTKGLLERLPTLISRAEKSGTVAFDLQLCYVFDGHQLSHGHRVLKRVLIKRGYANFKAVPDLDAPGMGELEGHYQPVAQGPVERIKDALLHDDRDPVRTWFDRHNRYSDWESHLISDQGARKTVGAMRSAQGRVFDAVPAKPIAFFFYSFALRRGYRDGRPGLNYALALAFYYWQISLKVREKRRSATID